MSKKEIVELFLKNHARNKKNSKNIEGHKVFKKNYDLYNFFVDDDVAIEFNDDDSSSFLISNVVNTKKKISNLKILSSFSNFEKKFYAISASFVRDLFSLKTNEKTEASSLVETLISEKVINVDKDNIVFIHDSNDLYNQVFKTYVKEFFFADNDFIDQEKNVFKNKKNVMEYKKELDKYDLDFSFFYSVLK